MNTLKKLSITLFIFIFFSILLAACLDITNLDRSLANYFFKLYDWDLNFYLFATIISSATVPIIAVIITTIFSKRRASELRINKLVNIRGELYILHFHALSLFTPLQHLPKELKDRSKYYVNQFSEIAIKFNNFSKTYAEGGIFLNKELTDLIEEYYLLINNAMTSWRMMHIEKGMESELRPLLKEVKDYSEKSKSLLEKIDKECKRLIEEYENY